MSLSRCPAPVCFVACVLLILSMVPVAAQESTQLTVVVVDRSGGTVRDAAVVITRDSDARAAATDGDGRAIVRGLATGAWTVEVSRDGFATVRRPVVVQVTPVTLTVTLEISGVRQNVIVSAAAPPEDALQLTASAAGGTRLDIPVRELPASLTVITQDLMQERGVNNIADAVELAPGITTFVDSGSIPGINSRGFSSTNGSVSVTRDGIRQNTVPQSGRPLDTFLLERVEVLKGPASLMSGEGAIGASINFVTKEPRRNVEIDTLLSAGSFDKYRLGLGISAPLTRTLAGRIDYSQTDGGGYVDRTGDEMRSAAASLRWTPRPSTLFKASAVWTGDSINSYYGTPIINGAIDPRTRYLNYNMRDNRNEATNNFGRLDASVVFAGWALHNGFYAATQRVEWRNYESVSYVPASQTVTVGSYFLAKRNDLLLGNQLDARRNFTVLGRAINFVGGYQYQNNDQDRWSGGSIPNQNRSVDPFNPAPIVDPGFPFVYDRNVKVFTHTLFGEAQVAVDDRLKVVSGVRVERFEVQRNQVTTGFAGEDYYPTTGRLGAVYLLNPVVTFYGSYSHAVEPVTPLVSLTPANMGFSLQPSAQWETGSKSTVLNGRLDFTVALFQINKENILTSTIVNDERVTQQIGEQRSRGVEVSSSFRPYSTLQVAADWTNNENTYLEFNENQGTGVISRAGNTVPHSPKNVWNITPTQRLGPLSVSATVRRVGQRFRDQANAVRLKPYTTLSAAVSARVFGDTRITVVVRNLTDEIYIPRSNSDVSGRVAAPRNFEVQLTRTFKPWK